MSQKLVLIDGHSILNRAFYGVPDLSNAEGLHTNAIYGFLNIMFKILEEEKPDYLAVAFDVHAPTFRHQMYQAYKGTRKPMPEELRQQVPVMKEVLKAMHITIMEQAGLEADDILGTLAKKAEQEGMEVSLVSGDRDLLQIATDHIKIRIPKTKQGRTEIEDYYAADVQAAYQVTPLQFIELKALMGDTADNIPGVPKVGEKTAQALMAEYGSLDNIYSHVEEISKKSIRESLIEHKDLAELSKTLATIKTDCDLQLDYDQAKAEGFYTPEAYTLCKRLEFKNLLGRFEKNAAATDTKITENFRIIEEKKEFLDFLKKAKKQKEIGLWLITEPAVGSNTKKEELEIPEEWLKIIQKPDGSWKKIIFYNTSIAALLENNEKMLEKMKDVFRIFKENKDEVALLWRPHPLIKSTVSSMRPQLWVEYEKLVKWYKEEGWGIYDDTSDMDRAVVLSDAYYGDASSVVQVYQETGKPVMIQSVEIRNYT